MGWLKYPLIDPSAEPEAFAPQPPLPEVEVPPPEDAERNVPVVQIGDLADWQAPVQVAWDDGEKFYGGYGPTKVLLPDYWTLRARSAQLFSTNLYARGLVRRLVTNEINTGLHLEAVPEEPTLGFPEDGLSDWAEDIENRFHLWEKSAVLCDYLELLPFGQLQQVARMEALVEGDILVMLRQDRRTGLPRVHLVPGSAVQSPLEEPRRGNEIIHGVERDARGRHVAFWVTQKDGTSKRVPAVGEKSGRRIAWLLYGTDKRHEEVRGKPLLSLVLQSLLEVDRYRDSTLRKAFINSLLALFIKKTEDKPGTLPITGGAVRRGTVTSVDAGGKERRFKMADMIPGVVAEELQHGEEPHPFPTGTDEKFGDFEAAIIQGVAWANEVPPEILRLSFSNNYSASQAAINEFKMYLNRVRTAFGDNFCAPIYREWLLSEAIAQRIDAPGLLESWRDPSRYDAYQAWIASEWAGQIKPAVDLSKLVRGYKEMVEEGFITRDRATRELTGMKFSKVAKRLRLENEQLAEANAGSQPTPQDDPRPQEPEDPDREDEEEERAA